MTKKEMKEYAVEVYTMARVKSKIIVKAPDAIEALAIAKGFPSNPEGVTDLDRTPIEGLGDLVWKYDGIEPEYSKDGEEIIEVTVSHEIKGPKNK